MLRPLLLTIQWRVQGVPWRAAWSIAKAKCYLGQRPWWRRHYNIDRWLCRLLVVLVWLSVTAAFVFVLCVTFAGVMWLWEG